MKTLQQKIDAIWHDIEYMDCIREIEINKALQDFGEQVLELKSHKRSGISKTDEDQAWGYGYQTAIIDVLALIGEQTNA